MYRRHRRRHASDINYGRFDSSCGWGVKEKYRSIIILCVIYATGSLFVCIKSLFTVRIVTAWSTSKHFELLNDEYRKHCTTI